VRYASLRQGLVGAWCPSVSGPYGYRLPDLSGYGNHGTLTNMDSGSDWVVSGGKGALDFDGSDDVVRLTLQNKIQTTTSFTMSAWVYTRNTNAQRNIFSTWKFNRQSGWQFTIDSANKVSAAFLQAFAQTYYVITSNTTIATNTWTNVLCVSSGDVLSNVNIFVNGTNSGKIDGPTTDPGPLDSTSLSIGAREANASYDDTFLNGQLDDIRIYNRALTPSEIRLLASERGIGLKPERLRNRYTLIQTPSRNRSSRFLGFPA